MLLQPVLQHPLRVCCIPYALADASCRVVPCLPPSGAMLPMHAWCQLPCKHALIRLPHYIVSCRKATMHVLIWFFRLRSDTTLGLLFDADFLDDPKHCPHPGLSSSSSPLLGDTPGDQPFLPPGFLAAVLGLAVIGITVTLMGALAFILLVQHHPMATVVATLAAQVMVPAAVGVMAMRNGKSTGH